MDLAPGQVDFQTTKCTEQTEIVEKYQFIQNNKMILSRQVKYGVTCLVGQVGGFISHSLLTTVSERVKQNFFERHLRIEFLHIRSNVQ